jgi:hypothetical protein
MKNPYTITGVVVSRYAGSLTALFDGFLGVVVSRYAGSSTALFDGFLGVVVQLG